MYCLDNTFNLCQRTHTHTLSLSLLLFLTCLYYHLPSIMDGKTAQDPEDKSLQNQDNPIEPPRQQESSDTESQASTCPPPPPPTPVSGFDERKYRLSRHRHRRTKASERSDYKKKLSREYREKARNQRMKTKAKEFYAGGAVDGILVKDFADVPVRFSNLSYLPKLTWYNRLKRRKVR